MRARARVRGSTNPLADEVGQIVCLSSEFLADHRHANRHAGTRPRRIVIVDVDMHRQPPTEEAGARGGTELEGVHAIQLNPSADEGIDDRSLNFLGGLLTVIAKIAPADIVAEEEDDVGLEGC